MAVGLIDQIAMNLIRKDQHIVFDTQLADTGQLLPGEYASCRVVRVAQQQHLGIGQFLIQIVEIDLVMSVHLTQRVIHHDTIVQTDLSGKRMIDRGLDHDAVSRLSKGPHRINDTRYHTGGKVEPFSLDFPSAVPIDPANDGLPVAVTAVGVAQNRVFGTFANGFCHSGWCCKIHIGYPHGNHIGPAENLFTEIHLFTVGPFP